MSALTVIINIVPELLVSEIRQEKEKKKHTDWKGRNKTVFICR